MIAWETPGSSTWKQRVEGEFTYYSHAIVATKPVDSTFWIGPAQEIADAGPSGSGGGGSGGGGGGGGGGGSGGGGGGGAIPLGKPGTPTVVLP